MEGRAQSGAARAMTPRLADRPVALIGFDGLQALDLVGPLEVFSKANLYAPEVGHAPFRYKVVMASIDGGEIEAGSGLCISRTVALRDLPENLDTVLIGGGSEQGLRAAGNSRKLMA